ncbi:MAG: glycosyltransferase [Candidatus Binataceae bacterium]
MLAPCSPRMRKIIKLSRDTKLFLYARMLRHEGVGSVLRRYADRAKEAGKRRRFQTFNHQSISRFASPRPPVLNFLASPPAARFGGTPLQLVARLGEEARRRSIALLYPMGNRYRLELEFGELRHSFEFSRAETPMLARIDHNFEHVIVEAARGLGTSTVHFEGVAGLPLESIAKLGRQGLRFIVSLHDFAFFCARPDLFEHSAMRFCNYCADLARCDRCLSGIRPVEAGAQRAHREAARKVLGNAQAVIYPSEFMRRQHRELFPEVNFAKDLVIEPAISSTTPHERAVSSKDAPKHVAFVGAATMVKGAKTFAEVVAHLSNVIPGAFRWSAFGGGDTAILAQLCVLGVTTRGYYRSGTLPSLLRRHAVDVALLLSTVPESFGLVLSECWMAGVPAIAFDHGAIADRIHRYGCGALVKLSDGSLGVAEVLEAIASRRAQIPKLEECAPLQTPQNAALAHLLLYKELGLFEQRKATQRATQSG